MMTKVVADRLSIHFSVYHQDNRSLKRALRRSVARGATDRRCSAGSEIVEDARTRVTVNVLKNLTFVMNEGERVGLIGANGAGKTTLLRALAGIYEPVAGRVRIEGTIGTLLDTQLGMNMELTGVENVRLRCLFYGYGRHMTQSVLHDVADFTDLGKFFYMPVKTYSTGMLVRLAFGLATAITPNTQYVNEIAQKRRT